MYIYIYIYNMFLFIHYAGPSRHVFSPPPAGNIENPTCKAVRSKNHSVFCGGHTVYYGVLNICRLQIYKGSVQVIYIYIYDCIVNPQIYA